MGKTRVENVDKVNKEEMLPEGLAELIVFTGFPACVGQRAFCGKKVDKR